VHPYTEGWLDYYLERWAHRTTVNPPPNYPDQKESRQRISSARLCWSPESTEEGVHLQTRNELCMADGRLVVFSRAMGGMLALLRRP